MLLCRQSSSSLTPQGIQAGAVALHCPGSRTCRRCHETILCRRGWTAKALRVTTRSISHSSTPHDANHTSLDNAVVSFLSTVELLSLSTVAALQALALINSAKQQLHRASCLSQDARQNTAYTSTSTPEAAVASQVPAIQHFTSVQGVAIVIALLCNAVLRRFTANRYARPQCHSVSLSAGKPARMYQSAAEPSCSNLTRHNSYYVAAPSLSLSCSCLYYSGL